MWIQFHFKNLIRVPWWPFIMYFCHPLSIILLNVTLIPFYSINSLWLSFAGRRVQALLLLCKPDAECVNSYSKGPQWITPSYMHVGVSPLHADSGLDHMIGFVQQGINKMQQWLEKCLHIRLPSLACCFGHPSTIWKSVGYDGWRETLN